MKRGIVTILILASLVFVIGIAGCPEKDLGTDTGIDVDVDKASFVKGELERVAELNKKLNRNLFPEDVTKEMLDSGNLINVDRENYPRALGVDDRNGKSITEIYFCRDVCPERAEIILLYDGVTSEADCNGLGGESLIDTFLTKKFVGCIPKI